MFAHEAISGMRPAAYPFSAIVGHQTLKRGLLMLAIEPGLRGALIASTGGSDEILLVRALGDLLSDPSFDFERNGVVVDLPLNITEDRLLGELDLERTIAVGNREVSTGVLARAHRRVLFVNDINLLDSSVAVHVAQALDAGEVNVEREGISATHEADFVLVGLFNSNEGEPNSLLRDRVGLIVQSAVDFVDFEKAEIVERKFRYANDPFRFAEEFAAENARLRRDIEDARARLPRVRASKAQLRRISQIALSLGVEGNRADVFTLKAARAAAALAGRRVITEEALAAAIQLVLVPRATTLPLQNGEGKEQSELSRREDAQENSRAEVDDADGRSLAGLAEDIIIETIDARVPRDLLSSSEQPPRVSRAGKRFKASASARGRYTRSSTHRGRDARIAIDATLRASAPYQLLRRTRGALKTGPVPGDAAGETPTRRVKIDPGDLRFKEFKHRSGILFTFAVDASGSMAVNRLAQAKGALIRLLQEAYLHRDQVALISFRGAGAEVLLAPTRSVELARRLVDGLPAGGGTPVSAGIVKAIELSRLARRRGMTQAMLVLFTDGRANVGLGGGRSGRRAQTIAEELTQLGALLRSEAVRSVVVDTKSRFISNGEAEALARLLGARYIHLPRSNAGTVYDAVVSITRTPGGNQDPSTA